MTRRDATRDTRCGRPKAAPHISRRTKEHARRDARSAIRGAIAKPRAPRCVTRRVATRDMNATCDAPRGATRCATARARALAQCGKARRDATNCAVRRDATRREARGAASRGAARGARCEARNGARLDRHRHARARMLARMRSPVRTHSLCSPCKHARTTALKSVTCYTRRNVQALPELLTKIPKNLICQSQKQVRKRSRQASPKPARPLVDPGVSIASHSSSPVVVSTKLTSNPTRAMRECEEAWMRECGKGLKVVRKRVIDDCKTLM